MSGPASADPGSSFTYTVTISENSLTSSDGATFTNTTPSGATGVAATCTASAGAACPAAMTVLDTSVSGRIVAMPHLGSITVTVTGHFANPSASSVVDSAHVDPPSNSSDSDPASNDSVISTAIRSGADLAVTWSQANETIGVGSPNTYTETVANLGPSDADGANWISYPIPLGSGAGPFSTYDVTVLSCAGAGGVECPPGVHDFTGTGYAPFDVTFDSFPAGAVLTVVYRVTPTSTGKPPCGANNGGLSTYSSVTAPTGTTDPNPDNNTLTSQTPGEAVPDCPAADLAVTWSQENETIGVGSPNTYTETVANLGPADADGANWISYPVPLGGGAGPFSTFDLTVLSCTGAGGVECPPGVHDYAHSGYAPFDVTFDSFPAGAVLTVVYQLTPNGAGQPGCGTVSGGIYSYQSVTAPTGTTDPNPDNDTLTESTLSACHDISVNQTVSPASVQAFAPVSFTSTVSSSGGGSAHSVLFTDPLPAGFVFTDASCATPDEASVCGEVVYDPPSRTVSSIIDTVADAIAPVIITINGTAGAIPATYTNTVSAQSGPGADAFVDPIPASNTSTVSVQVFNTAANIVITKSLFGLPTSGLAAPLTFAGEISCWTQGAKPWSVTIPAGMASASAPKVLFYGGESCSFTENDPPPAPAGYEYVDAAVFSPQSIEELPTSGTVDISSGTEVAKLGSLTIDSAAAVDAPVPGQTISFSMTIDNTGVVDADGMTATATLPPGLTDISATGDGTVSGDTVSWVPIDVPAGETLTLTVTATVGPATDGVLTVAFGISALDHFEPVSVGHACLADVTQSCASSTVFINSAPVAVPDLTTTTLGESVTLAVLDNDTDADIPGTSQILMVLAVTQPEGGEGTTTTDGTTVTFTPSAGFTRGSAVFSYTVSDGAGGTAEGTVVVTIPNVAPVGVDDSAGTDYLVSVTVDVLSNDTDVNVDPLTVTEVSDPAHGTATIVGTGIATQVLYTPNGGWRGTDTMTYTVSDGSLDDTATLTIDTGNGLPTAESYAVTVDGGVDTTLDPASHADDPNGDPITLESVVGASHGTVALDGLGGAVYSPDADYAGADSFDYTVSDGNGGHATGTVSVTVSNQSPTAVDDRATVLTNGTVDIDALLNDSDPNGHGTLTITELSGSTHGTASIIGSGADTQVRYVPDLGWSGEDRVGYSISDGAGGTATAGITITTGTNTPSANDFAVDVPGGVDTTLDVLAHASDPNGDPLTVSTDPTTAHGSLAVTVDGHVVYTPDAAYAGSDTFTYTVDDGNGGTATGTVSLTVLNQAPDAVDDDPVTVAHFTSITLDVLANDTDPNTDDVLVITSASALHGVVNVVGDGTQLEYLPAYGWRGRDHITYAISDGHDGVGSAEALVDTENAPPQAVWYFRVSVPGDVTSTFDLHRYASDANDDPLTFTVGAASHGQVVVNSDGIAAYTPDPGYAGEDSFTFTADDGFGGTAAATALLQVDAELHANADSGTTDQGVAVTIDVLANDTPGEHGALDPTTLVLVDPSNGSTTTKHLSLPGVGSYDVSGSSLTFSPLADFTGTAVVAYQITEIVNNPPPDFAQVLALDPFTAQANLTITVTPTSTPTPTPTPTPPTSQPPVPPAPTHNGDPDLANTGGPSGASLLLGIALLVAGGVLVLVGRRRRRN